MPDSVSKRCRVCGETKPLDGFYPRKDSPDGYRNDCRDCLIERTRIYYDTHRKPMARTKRKYQQSHTVQVFAHYGTSCVCCGTTENLSIDHIDGNGHEHRTAIFGKSQGRAGNTFYWWLVKQGFPPGYQTLCRRCNTSKGRGRRCILDHTAPPTALAAVGGVSYCEVTGGEAGD